jgi:hypothetical protein
LLLIGISEGSEGVARCLTEPALKAWFAAELPQPEVEAELGVMMGEATALALALLLLSWLLASPPAAARMAALDPRSLLS